MNRKTRIASLLALAGFLCMSVLAPLPAFASSPLLSGYGGPGSGEQTILGSTLVGGSNRGSGSGGSTGSGGSGAAAHGGSGAGGPGRTATGDSGGTAAGGPNGTPLGTVGSGRGSSSGEVRANATGALKTGSQTPTPVTGVYLYPSSLRMTSADTSVLAISDGDVLLLIATVAALAVLGVITARLSRLQR